MPTKTKFYINKEMERIGRDAIAKAKEIGVEVMPPLILLMQNLEKNEWSFEMMDIPPHLESMFDSSELKRRYLYALGGLFAKSKVQCEGIGLISEAWMAKVSKDEVKGENYPRASKHPKKEQVLVLSFYTLSGVQEMLMVPFDVNEKKQISFHDKDLMHINNDKKELQVNLLKEFWKGYVQA